MVSSLWRLFSAAIAGFVLFHGLTGAEMPPNYTFLHQATAAPKTSYYDYIVVGGGTSGCPLAATLSQKFKVLVLERGDSPYGNPNITDIANFGVPLADLSPTSPAQQFVSEDGIANARARVLGGGTCINAAFYSYAEEDFIRDYGWDAKLVNESYKWVEAVMVHEPIVRKWQSAFKAGLLEVGVTPYNGFTYNHLFGTKIGGTIFDKDGHRHTAADLFTYANPNSIDIFLQATAHKVLFQTKGESKPKATGVLFTDAKGIEHRAYLKGKGEVILSAGTLGSPQLLLLSGVGPKAQLQAHKIEVILDQPLVGQGMADNPLNVVFIPSPLPVELSVVEVVGITHTGNFIESVSSLNFVGGTPAQYGKYSYEEGAFIGEKFLGPASKGYLELRNTDPSANPIVRFNYFKERIDLERCIDGMKTIVEVIESKAFSKFKYESLTAQDILNITAHLPTNLQVHANTSLSLEQYCKDTVRTIWHYHGGCQVRRVIDHDYKVIGIDSLRVVDYSTFTDAPGTNPQATLLMLGRYMGVKITSEQPTMDELSRG